MDIVLKLLICFKLVLLLPSASSSRCSIENHHGCTYTVSCVQRPSKIAVVPCAYEANVNVTFEIKQSQLDTLTSAFFSATNYDTRIKHIIAHENEWHTLETHTFKYFSRTISLNLTGNGIVNINNETFFQLEHLQYLYLSHNKIKILFQKSLSLATANALEELDLSYNMLTSLQSPLFTSLKNLHTLHLQNNQLISICDECFSGLKNLAILYLQNNNITSLNATFIPLNLSLLDLSSNKIKTLNHSEISHMNALLYLNISYNLLETVDTYAFENTWKMEYLDLSHNKIFSSIEPQMFMNNHLLKYIDLFDNEITTIRELAFQFNSIKYIELDQNSLSINISRNCLKGLKNIKYLNITKEKITAINEYAFVDMENLQFLNLSRNYIEYVDNTSFEFKYENKLTFLDLSYNFINDLYFLQNFTSRLIELYLNNNKLTILRTGIFEKHTMLIRLDVSENDIILLEPFSLPLVKLQYFNINKNNLMGNITKNVFSPAPFIRFLNLNNLKIQGIDENAFKDLQLLTKLNLSNNEIEFIHSNNFQNMEKMYSLDLSYNKLSQLESKTPLNLLTAIYLNNNQFEHLPNLFSNKSAIIYIDISNNNIYNLESAGLENFPSVRVLKLSHNSIKIFNSNHTNALTNLSDLTLNSNQITAINLDCFEVLMSIDLSNNSISLINSTTFKNRHSLQYLDLSTNKISEIVPGTFQNLKILKFLNLSSNSLTYFRYGTFRGLSKTEMIDLSKNKLRFLDVNIFHDCDDLKKLIIDYNYIQTVNIETLIAVAPNLISLSLGGNPIACEEIIRSVKLKESKKLEVTSIHKIFHDDNVHGIRCGNASYNSSAIESHNKAMDKSILEGREVVGNSSTTVLLIWFFIITLLALLAIIYFIYQKQCKKTVTREYQINSVNMSSSECSI